MRRALGSDIDYGLNEIDKVVSLVPYTEHLDVLIEKAKQEHSDINSFPLVVGVLADVGELLELHVFFFDRSLFTIL